MEVKCGFLIRERTTFWNSTDGIFKTTSEIYKIGPSKEYRYNRKIQSSKYSEDIHSYQENWKIICRKTTEKQINKVITSKIPLAKEI